jgi:lantibiotic biosynthesis protein
MIAMDHPSHIPGTLTSQQWWRQSLARGALGIALLHVERAAAGLASWRPARDWLDYAVQEPVTAGAGSHLFYGAPALAYVLSRAAAGDLKTGQRTSTRLHDAITRESAERTSRAHSRIDNGLLPELAEFDLIRGLTGFGTYFLHHNPADDALRGILRYLVRLTEPVEISGTVFPGWWTAASPSGRQTAKFAGGHANLGLAHGIAGPLALLALATRHSVIVDGQLAAISSICAWLAHWHSSDPAEPAWPYWITLQEYLNEHRPHCWPQRLGWCYGTAGTARALQLAAIATGDPALRSTAENTLITALAAPANRILTTDPSLCHGQAGLARIAAAAAGDATDTAMAARLRMIADELPEPSKEDLAEPGLLDGAAGVALARTQTHRGWDTCLLIT